MDDDVEDALTQNNKRLDVMAKSILSIENRIDKEADDHIDILKRLLDAETQTAQNTAGIADMKALMEVQIELLKAQLQPMTELMNKVDAGFSMVRIVVYGIIGLAALITAVGVILSKLMGA